MKAQRGKGGELRMRKGKILSARFPLGEKEGLAGEGLNLPYTFCQGNVMKRGKREVVSSVPISTSQKI